MVVLKIYDFIFKEIQNLLSFLWIILLVFLLSFIESLFPSSMEIGCVEKMFMFLSIYCWKFFFCFIDIEKIKFISCHNPAMHSKIEKFSAQCKVYFLGVEVEFLFLWEKREKWRKCHWLSSSFLLLKVEINCLRNLCLPNKRKNFPWKLSFHKNSFKAQHKSIKLRFFSFLFTGIERGQIGHI